MNNQTFFVPMSFSTGSYKAVEYASRLAGVFNCRVALFHVVDARDIAESDNPIVVRRSIDRLVNQATNRITSFAEMISEAFDVPISYSVVTGNPASKVFDEVIRTKPELVFLGKNNSRNGSLKEIVTGLQIPAIVVPYSANVNQPSKIVLATDLHPVKHEALTMALDLSKKTTEALSLLYVQRNGSIKGSKKWVEHFSANFGVHSEFHLKKNPDVVAGIIDHASLHKTDLVCTVRRKRGLLAELFSRSTSVNLALRSEVPTMIIPEEYTRFLQPRKYRIAVGA
jgi:nucleotide-binding universal stress UspA family protein